MGNSLQLRDPSKTSSRGDKGGEEPPPPGSLPAWDGTPRVHDAQWDIYYYLILLSIIIIFTFSSRRMMWTPILNSGLNPGGNPGYDLA